MAQLATTLARCLPVLAISCVAYFGLGAVAACADEKRSNTTEAAQVHEEWFEREIRPLLAERCLSCHSSSLESPKANLKLDARATMLVGGDSGPAIEPGKPADSLILHAVKGQGMDRMPPDKPLTKPEIAALERWLELGAPWPERQVASPATGPDWLRSRAAAHWAWRPMHQSQPPHLRDHSWPHNDMDAFALARLEQLNIEPSPSASPVQLLRRLAFDLTGLPPTESQLARFAKLDDDASEFQAVYEQTLDEMLASPAFGVTWGRHWFDLVRYCETLGHEFDYPVRHAWRYRDAVIDAFNSDLPYDELVREHIAGDRVASPRRHETSGVNQSLAMTGWWWMGEGLHAPVDIWGDEATRVDNQIDVYSKTFLGLTVACARCHDHKFDAISAGDYTSLVGVLQSSRRTYAMDDPQGILATHNRQLRERVNQSVDSAIEHAIERATQQPIEKSAIQQWLDQVESKLKSGLDEARKQITAAHPLYPLLLLAETSTDEQFNERRTQVLQQIHDQRTAYAAWQKDSRLLADFSRGLPDGWYIEAADPTLTQSIIEPPRLLPFDPAGVLPARAATLTSHALGRSQQIALRSPTFEVTHPIVALRMRGKSAQSSIVVDNYFMFEFTGLLFGDLRKSVDQPHDHGWVTHGGDLKKYLGHPAYVSIEDDANAWFELSEVRLCDKPPPPEPSELAAQLLDKSTNRAGVKAAVVDVLQLAHLQTISKHSQTGIELLRASIMLGNQLDLRSPLESTQGIDREGLDTLAAATPEPVRLMAIHEGTPRNAEQTIRGNPHQRREPQPRCDLLALGGDRFVDATSSGRRELANLLTANDHPLTSRVMVNRVWHHLFGQGLVDSPDNFGLLGGAPSHPELLDNLAIQFIEHDWSMKWLVRQICTSRIYQLSSQPTDTQRESDPTARYLSHRLVRRMSAEKLRDTLLAMSGSLDRTLDGPSVKVHLTEQMTGRGRPGESGPLDGAGRRSVFVEMRRNFLDPFLVAFDQPPPATTVGKRNLSNVPAQALSMLNDPLVHTLVDRWSQRLQMEHTSQAEQVNSLIRAVYSRQAAADELQRCLNFLNSPVPGDKLAQLAHVLLCSKEFLYVP